jgi:hypothetical protein
MPNDDSDYLSGLRDDSGEPVARFLKALRRSLRYQIKRRGLWNAPSSLIGPTELLDCSEILEDLVQQFVLRRLSLLRRIAAGSSVDRCVKIYVRHFVSELQAQHDKIGHAAFKNVVGAVKLVAKTGTFEVLCKPVGQIEVDAVLVATGAEATAARAEKASLSDALFGLGAWRRLLETWAQSPGLVFRKDTDIQDLLRDCLVGLPGRGIRSFRLGDFVDIVKSAAREVAATESAKYQYIEYGWEGGDDDERGAVPLDWPTFGIDEQEELDRFVATVSARIDAMRRDARVSTRKVFVELVEHARLYPEAPFPRPAEIAQRLGVARQRVHDVLETLRKIIQEIRRGKPDT